MLKEEVLHAVRNNTYEIYAIENVDEGMEILTGIASGKRDEKGNFPKKSIGYQIEDKLRFFADKSRQKKYKKERE